MMWSAPLVGEQTEGGSAPALVLGFSSTSIMKGAASCMAMLALPYLGVL